MDYSQTWLNLLMDDLEDHHKFEIKIKIKIHSFIFKNLEKKKSCL